MPQATPLFLALQGFVVLFVALHDWVPLGRLNDVRTVRSVDSKVRLVSVTVLSTLPFAIAFAASVWYAREGFPGWLMWLLWLSYLGAVYGMLRTWWVPYLLVADPVRAARYQAMFGRTLAFLPERNGIRPNTLHLALHVVIVIVVVLLARMSFGF